MTDLAIFHDFTPDQQEAACLVERLRFARDYKQASAHNVCRDFYQPRLHQSSPTAVLSPSLVFSSESSPC